MREGRKSLFSPLPRPSESLVFSCVCVCVQFFCIQVDDIFVVVVGVLFRLWHPGLTDDLHACIQRLSRDVPLCPVFLVGYSAGANIVQKTLNKLAPTATSASTAHKDQKAKEGGVKGGMCVCVCQDYAGARDRLESSVLGCLFSSFITQTYKVGASHTAHTNSGIWNNDSEIWVVLIL